MGHSVVGSNIGRRPLAVCCPSASAVNLGAVQQTGLQDHLPQREIYVGMDLTGTISYFGGPSAKDRIAADLAEHRPDSTVRKQILWESDTATDAEVCAMEVKLIREVRSNDPAVGYNLAPKFLHPDQGRLGS
jgi:hypothetical protein